MLFISSVRKLIHLNSLIELAFQGNDKAWSIFVQRHRRLGNRGVVLLAREVLLSHYSQVRWYYLVERENISIKPIEQSNQTYWCNGFSPACEIYRLNALNNIQLILNVQTETRLFLSRQTLNLKVHKNSLFCSVIFKIHFTLLYFFIKLKC